MKDREKKQRRRRKIDEGQKVYRAKQSWLRRTKKKKKDG